MAGRRRTMHRVTDDGTRAEQLRALALVIADQIDAGDESHSMAQLARQYRETIAELEAVEGEADADGLEDILG